MFSPDTLKKAGRGHLDTLVALDRRGLILGANETPSQYAKRLRCLAENIAEMETELAGRGYFMIEGFRLVSGERIPRKLFDQVAPQTEDLYGFSIDWVPGFFVTPSFGWLFAGCAFYFDVEFFALFIIRKSFAHRDRFLFIYRRQELLAHELCHIARLSLQSRKYEEMFAYRTSFSAFRRAMGSVFRRPSDSFLVLGSVLLLLCAQLVQSFVLPSLHLGWILPFWGVVIATVAVLGIRNHGLKRTYHRARQNLIAVDAARPDAVLFRCADDEINRIAELSDSHELRSWIAKRCGDGLRWQVIRTRFLA